MSNKTLSQPPVPRRPTSEQIQRELDRLERKRGMPLAVRIILFLIVVILIAAITFFCLLSGYVIYGNSMSPSLEEKDMVLAIPKAAVKSGDLVAFRHDDRILIKRVIAGPGDSIEVMPDGHVRLNGSDLYESYALYSSAGIDDMTYPVDVPANSWFVLGDNRGNSVDSRSSIIGLIDSSNMLGKVFIRIWPLNRFELFDRNFFPQLVDALRPG